MHRCRTIALALVVTLACVASVGGQTSEAPTPEVIADLQRTLAAGIGQFEAMSVEGVLYYVSDQYRSGGLTKPVLRQQLTAVFAAHDSVRARIHIDEVRMVGDRAWVRSSGDVTGRVRFLGTVVPLRSWHDSWEVAWREGGIWRLIGDQQ
jgi:hypothetical protein